MRSRCSMLVHWWSRGIGSNGCSVTLSLGGLRDPDRGALVADLSDKAVDVVSGVLGCLDPAVGQSNHIAASNNTVGILGLGLLEVSLGVVIGHSILIGEWLRGKLLLLVRCRGWVVRGGGTIGWGTSSSGHSEDNRGNNKLQIERG